MLPSAIGLSEFNLASTPKNLGLLTVGHPSACNLSKLQYNLVMLLNVRVCRTLAEAMKGADAVICAIGSGGFSPKGPKTVDYGVCFVPKSFVPVAICANPCLNRPHTMIVVAALSNPHN